MRRKLDWRGLKKRGWSGNTSPGGRSMAAAAASRPSRSAESPFSSHSCRHESRIQSPLTFLRKRTVPKAPPSFVKFTRATAGVTSGAFRSTPTSDQVPEDKRSLALRVVMRAPDRTLNEKDIAGVRAKILKALEREFQATLR